MEEKMTDKTKVDETLEILKQNPPEEILQQDLSEDKDNFSNYSSKGEFSKAMIVSETIKKVIESRCKEMRSGYFNTTQTPDGCEIKQWVPDSRKEFISSVNALLLTLSPEIDSNDEIKSDIQKYETKKKEIFEKYCYQEREKVEGKRYLIASGAKFMPEIDHKCKMYFVKNDGERILGFETGLWNNKVEQYWNELLELTDDLFKKLNLLLHKIEYFNNPISYA